ncbi:MAG: hypothetical protein JWO31_119 [Phycisphaerales bacterium]|nr:hypothetical protein [Phycisphaerales bacterium]
MVDDGSEDGSSSANDGGSWTSDLGVDADADTLDAARIRRLAAGRRAVLQVRSYAIAATAAAAFASGQFVWTGSRRLATGGIGGWVIAELLAAGALVAIAAALGRRVRRYNAELAVRPAELPAAEPDFSTLSDGSGRADQLAENLWRVSGPP